MSSLIKIFLGEKEPIKRGGTANFRCLKGKAAN